MDISPRLFLAEMNTVITAAMIVKQMAKEYRSQTELELGSNFSGIGVGNEDGSELVKFVSK